jgi:hypothetical protein
MSSSKTDQSRKRYWLNLTLTSVAAQVGCLTLVIVLLAVFGGLWLDARFQSRPIITIVLLVASIPVSLIIMLFVVRQATSRIKVSSPDHGAVHSEEENIGKNS